jgi:hypothetical protein
VYGIGKLAFEDKCVTHIYIISWLMFDTIMSLFFASYETFGVVKVAELIC